jgi:hypothetical protein
MEYTKRNKQSTTHLAETPTLLAQLYRLQTQLSCTDKAERLCHELLAALTHALQNEPPQHLINRIRRQPNKPLGHLQSMSTTDAHDTLTAIRALRTLAREKSTFRGRRKLDTHRQEILQLRKAGASQHDIRLWLKRERRCQVAQSTISKYLKDIDTHVT